MRDSIVDMHTEPFDLLLQHTPLMKQYHEIKLAHADALVLFQVGDFYELFYQDAIMAAACLSITLTQRGKNKGQPIPLCGFPIHAHDVYVSKLVKAGYKVVVCDQLEEATPGTVVRRGVTNVLTPGTLTDSKLLDGKSASYLFVCVPYGMHWGVVSAEFLTAQLFGTCIARSSDKDIETELIRFFPDEIVLPDTDEGREHRTYFKKLGYYTTLVPLPDEKMAREWVDNHFSSHDSTFQSAEALQQAMVYFYAYLAQNQRHALSLFTKLSFYKPDDFLILDATTQKNLDLVRNSVEGKNEHTLFSVLDHAATSMGSRMIKKWIMRPLAQRDAIEQRFDMVSFFLDALGLSHEIYSLLRSIGDIERVIGRICLLRSSVHDYRVLGHALRVLPAIAHVLYGEKIVSLPAQATVIADQCLQFQLLGDILHKALDTDGSDYIIKHGFDTTLDMLRATIGHSQQDILTIEKKEQEKTGICSLKIRYNGIHGYCIEITKTHKDVVPDTYIRVQTLVGKERFTTVELQLLHSDIMRAQETVEAHEKSLFDGIKKAVIASSSSLRRLAYTLATCDGLISFALCAHQRRYVRPVMTTDRCLLITQGRHPVVEQSMSSVFIPNDTVLTDDHSLMIITGPNMGGKSTYLRQVALSCIMAHCGSFVPAHAAKISVLDRIFTRIGAGDNLAQGKSTFLVEMEEAATICTQATENSLVILDELGRGTSTYDGLVIAHAVIEYIYNTVRARCLFATHYHELSSLHEHYPGIVPYHAVCKKTGAEIVFLYRIMRGVAEGSFGIDVAHLAKLPSPIIARARELLEGISSEKAIFTGTAQQDSTEKNKHFYQDLLDLDLDGLSGRDALNLLHEWQKKYL